MSSHPHLSIRSLTIDHPLEFVSSMPPHIIVERYLHSKRPVLGTVTYMQSAKHRRRRLKPSSSTSSTAKPSAVNA